MELTISYFVLLSYFEPAPFHPDQHSPCYLRKKNEYMEFFIHGFIFLAMITRINVGLGRRWQSIVKFSKSEF
jgi:hypothetical protein